AGTPGAKPASGPTPSASGPPPPPGPTMSTPGAKPVLAPAPPVTGPMPPPPPAGSEKATKAARPGRGLAWLALVVGLLGLAAAVVAVAGPRILLLADRYFPQAAWIEPAGRV